MNKVRKLFATGESAVKTIMTIVFVLKILDWLTEEEWDATNIF